MTAEGKELQTSFENEVLNIQQNVKQVVRRNVKVHTEQQDSSEILMPDSAVEAMDAARNGIHALSSFVMQVALFWKKIQEHCKALGEDELKKTVEDVM